MYLYVIFRLTCGWMILSSSNFIVSDNTGFYQNKFLGTSGMQHNVKFDHNLIWKIRFTCAVDYGPLLSFCHCFSFNCFIYF